MIPDLPSAPSRTCSAAFGLDYKFVLNALATIVFVTLLGLTIRRGAADPVCGMTVDRSKARRLEHAGTTYYFCSDNCLQAFQHDPDRYTHAHHEPSSSATVRVH